MSRGVLTAIALLIVLGTVAAYWTQLPPPLKHEAKAEAASLPVRIILFSQTPFRHDLGTQKPNARIEISFLLVNDTAASVELGEAISSCECLTVHLDSRKLESQGVTGGRFVIDLSKEPEFTGSLMLTAEIKSANRMALAARLTVDVK